MENIKNKKNKKGSAVAIGNFDGLHLGHQKLIETLKKIAIEKNLISMILTFTPNPKVYFNKDLNLINSEEQKKQIMGKSGVDNIILLNFEKILNMSGETFVKNILIDKFNVKFVVMGQNFKFGKNRENDAESLKKMGEKFGFEYTIVNPVILNGTPISSSLIRKKLVNAEIEASNRMLGRLYYIDGVIKEGDKIGRQLGFPTINIQTQNEILPDGVFKTRTQIDQQEQIYDSITYIGASPTFSGKEKKVETHILGFDKKVYGNKVKLYFEKKLRDEMRFDSKKKLINQIKKDIRRLKVDKGAFFW